MRVIHTESEEVNVKKRKPNVVLGTFLSLFIVYLVSFAMTAAPGTYAWLTSETSATGTITNATTKDLLEFQSSKVRYGEQCRIQHTLKVKNISEMNTTVTVSLSAGSGYESVKSKELKPGQTLTVKPDLPRDSCETESLPYRIQAFHHYVDETYSVSVDTAKLKETIVPAVQEKPEVEKEEEKTKKKEEPPVEQPATEKPEKEEAEEPAAEQPSTDTGQEGEPAEAEEGNPTGQEGEADEPASGDQVEETGASVQAGSNNPSGTIDSEQKEE